jgi:hypothetical protein
MATQEQVTIAPAPLLGDAGGLGATGRRAAAAATPASAAAPQRRRVEAMVAQLAAAARTLSLYDVRNDTVRRAIEGLVAGLGAVLAKERRLRLVIRPFEIAWQGHRVYLDTDLERSLAFRLYRDGVRALVVRAGVDASELARFLAILTPRQAGLRRHEDDLVTLLWDAGLRFVEVVAVDSLRPGVGTAEAEPGGLVEPRPYLPEDADLPWSGPTAGAPPEWLEVDPARLARLVREEEPVEQGLRLLVALTSALEDPKERMRFAEVKGLAEELRDTLLSAERLPQMLSFVHQLRRLARGAVSWDPDRHSQAVEVIRSCGDDRAVRRLIHSVPEGETEVRPEMVGLLDLVCPDPITAVTVALVGEDRAAARAVARQLVEHYGKRYGVAIRQQFGEARGRAAADLLRTLTHLEGEATPEFLARQCAHPDAEVREEAFWHLERGAFTSTLGPGFVAALRQTRGPHRRRVLALIEGSRDRRFVPPLLELLGSGLDLEEAVEVARVVGLLEGRDGLARWERWLTPRGRFFRRRLPGGETEQVAAAAAVAQAPGQEASHLLRLALSAASPATAAWLERFQEEREELVALGRAS